MLPISPCFCLHGVVACLLVDKILLTEFDSTANARSAVEDLRLYRSVDELLKLTENEYNVHTQRGKINL